MFKRPSITQGLCRVALAASLLCGACSSQSGNSLLSRKTVIPNQPITTWVWGKYVDETKPLEYYVKFRNTSTKVISFDYTISDKKGVPHVDRDGPNSGFVPNLYPGAEATIPNPLKRWDVFVKVGKVTHGKHNPSALQTMYPSDAMDESSLGLPPEIPAPGGRN